MGIGDRWFLFAKDLSAFKMMVKNSFIFLLIAFVLSGCGGADRSVSSTGSAAHLISLSKDQQRIVQAGLREMVTKATQNAGHRVKSAGLKAFRLSNSDAIQVCGDVSYGSKKTGLVNAPYYLELAQKQGRIFAKRGQIGLDNLKKSKVIFMCARGQ